MYYLDYCCINHFPINTHTKIQTNRNLPLQSSNFAYILQYYCNIMFKRNTRILVNNYIDNVIRPPNAIPESVRCGCILINTFGYILFYN